MFRKSLFSILKKRKSSKDGRIDSLLSSSGVDNLEQSGRENRQDENGGDGCEEARHPAELVVVSMPSADEWEDEDELSASSPVPVARKSFPVAPESPTQATTVSDISAHCPTDDNRYSADKMFFQYIDDCRWEKFVRVLEKLELAGTPAEIRKLLLARSGPQRETCLHAAFSHSPAEVNLMLLQVIPETDCKHYLLSTDSVGNTPLHRACAQLPANSIDDLCVIKSAASLVPESLDVRNHSGDTPLHLLLGSEAFVSSASSDFSVELSAEGTISMLLEMVGAENVASLQNDEGQTLLHVACSNNCHERVIVQLLKQTWEAVSISDDEGRLPLHFVATSPSIPWTVVNEMIVAYPESVVSQTNAGDTPLHLMMEAGSMFQEGDFVDRNTTKIAELLLACPDTDDENSDEISSLGSDMEKSPLMILNDFGFSPLHLCALSKAPVQLTRLLVESRYGDAASALRTNTGATALHLISGQSFVADVLDQVRLLSANPVVCTMMDRKHRTPLAVAVANKKIPSDAIKLLCDASMKSLTIECKGGKKVLQIALERGSKAKSSVVKALLKADSQLSFDRYEGETMLHIAAREGCSNSIMIALLEHYPEAIAEPNENGDTPMDLIGDMERTSQLISALSQKSSRGRAASFRSTSSLRSNTSSRSMTSSGSRRSMGGSLRSSRSILHSQSPLKSGRLSRSLHSRSKGLMNLETV